MFEMITVNLQSNTIAEITRLFIYIALNGLFTVCDVDRIWGIATSSFSIFVWGDDVQCT